ncbi:hypothetical protein [Schleiferilactobacillus perolens]|jgi:hypothetical protein|uniref:Uncharacterized protein n=1 Tax=Schleiferilactobacillus perolens DSM 12744 TaxID=1423792 RepID=A0A0R1NAW2_9LACO|nr:hypothetical protein [Schleiferilactobacillus perolens]KRL14059.1 hypothetical protein FD09_GL001219 [Schleiferilactobacillus perolens DSM 12744]MCI1890762.1 hypothetical protein [Schleiferilactobacillus harbinensis]MCI1912260.1 hypothetical protein [Schleiferilactobacillus harbinensis]MCI2171917.1 hypothetical protein [Schleiferilactobacillus perolens]
MAHRQDLQEISAILDQSMQNEAPVKIRTIDHRTLIGAVSGFEEGTVKPYFERRTVFLNTKKGVKRIKQYAIQNVMAQ